MVPDGTISQVLDKPVVAQDKVEELIKLANENGGRDNITVILASIRPDKKKLQRMKRQAWFRENKPMLKKRLMAVLYGIICLIVGYILGMLFPF